MPPREKRKIGQIIENFSGKIASVSGESVAVAAGAAGTMKDFQIVNFPIRNASGAYIGVKGDTSLAFSGNSLFGTEVDFGTDDDDMANGEWWVDYLSGAGRLKKGTTDTSATAAYKILEQALRVTIGTGTPESGTDATGADTYATVLTPSTTFSHIMIVNEGVNPATVSLDGGATDHFIRIPGQSVQAFDAVTITAVAIQAKNANAGNNYTNLTIIVW